MMEKLCSYTTIRKTNVKTVTVNCRDCDIGNSTIFDEICRSNIFKILQTEHGVDRLILNHVFVKIFRDEALEILKGLTHFIENIDVYNDLEFPTGDLEKCKKCTGVRREEIQTIIESSKTNPVKALSALEKIQKRKKSLDTKCNECERKYNDIIAEMVSKAEFKKYSIEKNIDSDLLYTNCIRPYVRPS